MLSDLWLPFPGGAERLMFNLGRLLMERNVVVAFTGYEQPQQFDGPIVMRSDLPLDDEGWRIVDAVIEGVEPDVIVTHHLYAHTWEHELCGLGIPIVQLVLNGKRMPGAALGVHISRWVAERANPAAGDLIVRPPAFDDVIADVHGDGIGFVKPIEHKGVELFYAIAARMPEREFVVLRGEWQTLEDVRALPNVRYVEPVDDMRDFYAQVRVMLVPSLSEDAGTVAQEATLNGLPCVSSNVCGLVETNAGGLRLTPGVEHVASWVRAIRQLDSRSVYRHVVARQRRVLAARDGELRAFVEAVESLAE